MSNRNMFSKGTVSLSYRTGSKATRDAVLRLDVDDAIFEVVMTPEQFLGFMSTLVVDGVMVESGRRSPRVAGGVK